MELSQKIYELRTGSGLSQLDLAEKLGVSRQSVSKWETGQAVPDLDKLIRLADLFGISVDELVREGERPAPPEPQVVYVAEQRGFSPVQKAGAALEVVGLLGLVLGGMGLVSLIGAGLMLLGLPLLLCKKDGVDRGGHQSAGIQPSHLCIPLGAVWRNALSVLDPHKSGASLLRQLFCRRYRDTPGLADPSPDFPGDPCPAKGLGRRTINL